ncbi:hypothetical protein POM88_054398 [Heracleum sosnowskyi]|uniref:BTB domain-containing protein n=1 Tax=Heracleum sosnowskyi TaxID=360622 RepID=A0AAD8LWP6_9APIA|nr:hypothetical protein POM88_054398 [Heracleum sosnowskyi]
MPSLAIWFGPTVVDMFLLLLIAFSSHCREELLFEFDPFLFEVVAPGKCCLDCTCSGHRYNWEKKNAMIHIYEADMSIHKEQCALSFETLDKIKTTKSGIKTKSLQDLPVSSFPKFNVLQPQPQQYTSGYGGNTFTMDTEKEKLLRNSKCYINASDGSIGADRTIFAARSPVFRTMFSHDLEEKELSTVDISGMSTDEYDVSDLKEACHDSLLEDIDAKNVLGRLYNAFIYQLPKLKSGCMQYLVKFGKIYDLGDDLNTFLQSAK